MSQNQTTPVFDVTNNVKFTIPFYLFRHLKALPPQIVDDEIINITEEAVVKQTRVEAHTGNEVDRVLKSDNFGYFIEENTTNATIVFLGRQQVKQIMLEPSSVPREVCNLVVLKKDGSMLPGFLPDFGDLALLPKPLKLVLKWMFQKAENTPPLLRRLWLSTSPTIPTERNETVVQYGFTRFRCFSFPSRLHLFKVPLPSFKRITFEVYCEDVSSCPMDGRKYKFELSVSQKKDLSARIERCGGEKYELVDRPNVHIMVWNCQGMGRPSFVGNLKHLMEAHRPDIVVLLETRVSKHLLQSLIPHTMMFRLVGISPAQVYGGVAVISTMPKVQFVAHDRKDGKISGCLKGSKMIYF